MDTTQSGRWIEVTASAGRMPARACIIYVTERQGQPEGVRLYRAAAVNPGIARRACHDPLGVGDRVLAALP